MGFNFFVGLFDFDGDGCTDETDAFFGTLFIDEHSGGFGTDEYDPEEDENSDEFDPFDAQDFYQRRRALRGAFRGFLGF